MPKRKEVIWRAGGLAVRSTSLVSDQLDIIAVSVQEEKVALVIHWGCAGKLFRGSLVNWDKALSSYDST